VFALFIAFQALWLNVVVPGHTRGAVTLPGLAGPACATAGAGWGCCGGAGERETRKSPTPTPEQRSRCAVCAFAARVTPPPVIDLAPPLLEIVRARPVEAPRGIESVELRLAYHGRAPPAAA
jgi:hypothetical protein